METFTGTSMQDGDARTEWGESAGAADAADAACAAGAVGSADAACTAGAACAVDAACAPRTAPDAPCAPDAAEPAFANSALTREYLQIMEELDGDPEGRRKAHDYMASSTAIVHGKVVDSSFVPRLYDAKTREAMRTLAQTAHGILEKVMRRYLDDPSYRSEFSFDPRLAELILLPRGYDSILPFARVDVFLDEETGQARFCEFNGDGSSGMNENREITVSVAGSATFREFARRHRIETCELFHSWVDTFVRIYRTYEHAVQEPRFAICDYLENGVVDEFRIFARFFRIKGYPCSIVDVRDLRFDGAKLCDKDGNRIHAIWRRCVTNDVLEHWDESQDLIEAVRCGKVALIGSFAGHLVHDKQIFRVLHGQRTMDFLTEGERRFVRDAIPYTAFLTEEELARTGAREDKDAWIVKPADHYGADQVFAGIALSAGEWNGVLDRILAQGGADTAFILQRYVTPYRTETLPPDTGIADLADGELQRAPERWNNISGLYLYDGEFMGVFSRLGPLPTISKDMRGMTAATVWVDC